VDNKGSNGIQSYLPLGNNLRSHNGETQKRTHVPFPTGAEAEGQVLQLFFLLLSQSSFIAQAQQREQAPENHRELIVNEKRFQLDLLSQIAGNRQ
jgi:hypothetical protein